MSPDSSPARVGAHLRRLRVRAVRDRLRESLLFLPATMLLVSVVVAIVLAGIDGAHRSRPLPWTFSFAPDTASTLLGIIAGATITTAGVVFSLLVVSLQLASGQFSPRVLRGFWRDQFGQVLIGLLLSTFAFCVLALARLDTGAKRAPALSVMFALLLTLASVIFIVLYLDRISRQQYVGNIVARVAGETLHLIGELPYGRHIGMRVGEAVPAPGLDTLGGPFTPADLDHPEHISHAFDQIRLYASAHPQVLMAIARTQRMLRGACLLSGGREEVIAALDRQLAMTVASCAPGMLPEDRIRVEQAADPGLPPARPGPSSQ